MASEKRERAFSKVPFPEVVCSKVAGARSIPSPTPCSLQASEAPRCLRRSALASLQRLGPRSAVPGCTARVTLTTAHPGDRNQPVSTRRGWQMCCDRALWAQKLCTYGEHVASGPPISAFVLIGTLSQSRPSACTCAPSDPSRACLTRSCTSRWHARSSCSASQIRLLHAPHWPASQHVRHLRSFITCISKYWRMLLFHKGALADVKPVFKVYKCPHLVR